MKCAKCQFENPSDTFYCGKCGAKLTSVEERPPSVTETMQTPVRELSTGTTFAGRYQVIEELGKGGMGRVYKVLDKEIKEKVALKLLKPEIAADRETIERFSNELKYARKISHRNVCRMYDLGKAEGTHFITMEYVHGEDLKRLIRKVGQLGTGKTILIVKQVCEGLAEAHRLGVVHRDLKPQNIMVDEEGNARIMDFGIARSVRGKGITGAGVMIGTPEYMSPEQVEGKEVDQRSDIYSLGVILYEMVTGRVPFEGDTPFTIGVKHKSEIPKNPKELNAQISDDLSRLILRCLEKDKEKRFESAEAVLLELERIEQGLPTTERVIPARKPFTSREITVQFSLRKLLVPALAIVAIVIAAIVIWQILPAKKTITVPEGKSALAVLYLENNTGDLKLDHWRKGLSELMITDLSQSRYFHVLSGDQIYDLLKGLDLLEAKSYSSHDLADVASRGGATHILRGGFIRAADIFRINIMIQDAKTRESVASEKVEGQGEGSFYSMVDELTRRIKQDLKLSPQEISSDFDKEVGEITTSSPEAYQYYIEARKYHLSIDYRQAIPLYEKAVALDPGFAMAYRGMASTYSNLGYEEKSRESIQKAMDLTDRVSDRERYQIQGNFYAQSERTYDKAIEAFTKLLGIYPDDQLGNNWLGLIYGDLEELEKAAERDEECIKTAKDILNYANLGDTYEALGLYDRAQDVYQDYLENVSDSARVHCYLGWNYLYRGKFDLALKEAEKSFLLAPGDINNFYLKGDIFHLQGDFPEAEKEYLMTLEKGEKSTHILPRFRLAALYLAQGQFEKAKDQLKQAGVLADELNAYSAKANSMFYGAYFELKSGNPKKALDGIESALKYFVESELFPNQRYAMAQKGVALLELGSSDKAQTLAEELKEFILKGLNKKSIRYYHYLQGQIELKKANYPKAIENFQKAVSFLHSQYMINDEQAIFYDALALAYYKAGNLEEAQKEYERITSLTGGRGFYGDIYAKSFYMLGKIFEQKKDKTKAIANYQKFLELWKNADPGFAEVEDAKRRISGGQALPS